MKSSDDHYRILIVEDDQILREMLEHYLRNGENAVDLAVNGREGLEKHMQNGYDLIITDLNMPEMTGIDLVRNVREKDDFVEFIIITGYATLESAVEAIKIGAFDYIVKPFKLDELRVSIKNACDKITLKKANRALLEKLKSFHEEIDRYKLNQATSYTEKIAKEMESLARLRKEGLLKDDELDDFRQRILKKIL
jgi:DNA-binding NtrC family response regulator